MKPCNAIPLSNKKKYWYIQQLRWISSELCWVERATPKRLLYDSINVKFWTEKQLAVENRLKVTKKVRDGATGDKWIWLWKGNWRGPSGVGNLSTVVVNTRTYTAVRMVSNFIRACTHTRVHFCIISYKCTWIYIYLNKYSSVKNLPTVTMWIMRAGNNSIRKSVFKHGMCQPRQVFSAERALSEPPRVYLHRSVSYGKATAHRGKGKGMLFHLHSAKIPQEEDRF